MNPFGDESDQIPRRTSDPEEMTGAATARRTESGSERLQLVRRREGFRPLAFEFVRSGQQPCPAHLRMSAEVIEVPVGTGRSGAMMSQPGPQAARTVSAAHVEIRCGGKFQITEGADFHDSFPVQFQPKNICPRRGRNGINRCHDLVVRSIR